MTGQYSLAEHEHTFCRLAMPLTASYGPGKAAQVCEEAGVPLEVVPLTDEYWDRVVSHSIAETRAGRTPNPDVWCNSRCGHSMTCSPAATCYMLGR